MDVRGPKRAAARRLIQGMVVASALGAVAAPAATASTVSNVHPTGVAGQATYDDADGIGTTLTLTSAGADSVALTDANTATTVNALVDSGVVVPFDNDDTCLPPDPPATPPAPTDPPVLAQWTCSLATRLTANLGGGNDTVRLGNSLPPLDINGGEGSDTLDLSPRSGVTANLSASEVVPGVTSTSVENVTGTPKDDTLTGDAAANVLTGDGGTDNIRGGDGGDTLDATGSNGTMLLGGAGADTFVGGASTQILALDDTADKITCSDDRTDIVTANLGAGGVTDEITNPDLCGTITGTVASLPPATTTETTIQPVIVVPALGTPALRQVLAPGKPDVKDLTPPSASMRSFTRQRLKTVADKGVPLRVSCREACGISIALSVDRKTARRLKLDSRSAPIVIATATAKRATAGTTILRVKFLKRVRPALKRSRRAVTMTTQVLVSDASGNGTLLSRHVTLVK
jgi:hemolysin type calcium-binding protein